MRYLRILAWILSLAACAWGETEQPIPFSHKTHIGDVKLTCADCHPGPAKFGDPVGIPDAPKCLECHPDSEKRQPIPWVRSFRLKDFVFFDHLYHLQNKVKCEDCHGPIGTEDVVTDQVKTTSMTSCQRCHVKTGARTACTTCHDPR